MKPGDLPRRWRGLAAETARYYGPQRARVLEVVADELEAALREQEDELLTLNEAAEESGYSTDHLAREIRQGKLQNYGRKGSPRVRRGELPKKAKGEQGGTGSNAKVYDVNRLARKIADSKFGS